MQPSALAEANSDTRLAPLRRPVQRARCRAHFSGARGGIGTGILGSRIFSHVRCLWELESSCSIFVPPPASCLRPSGWTTLCISLDHFCIIFSRSPLLLRGVFLTLRVSSSSNSSLIFHLNPGCPSKSLHASSFIFWKRSSSSARAFQWSRLRRSSSRF